MADEPHPLLEKLETARDLERIAAAAGVNAGTVQRWIARGDLSSVAPHVLRALEEALAKPNPPAMHRGRRPR